MIKSTNPELSQRLDEIPTDKPNTSTSSPDTIHIEEETQSTDKEKHLKELYDTAGELVNVI